VGGLHSYAEHTSNPAVAQAGLVSQPRATWWARRSASATPTRPCSGGFDTDLDRFGDGSYDRLPPWVVSASHRDDAGEVTPGGTGTGLYTILIYAIVAVFIGGLMIGRTPEYLGKKIQATEVKLAGLGRWSCRWSC